MRTSSVLFAAAFAGLASAFQEAFRIGVVGNEVACSGVSIPSDGVYAAVSNVFITPDSCGGTVDVTDTTTGKSLSGVPVVSEFPNCDSPACAGYVVRLSPAAFTALGESSTSTGFVADWTVTPA